ncbi:MAG: hypothetical protein ACM3SV_12035 [Betaproteobacteria bacterium]
MLNQLGSVQLSFVGKSMAQLMFKIANEAHRNIVENRPDLLGCLVAVIDNALRYQRDAEMAADLKN